MVGVMVPDEREGGDEVERERRTGMMNRRWVEWEFAKRKGNRLMEVGGNRSRDCDRRPREVWFGGGLQMIIPPRWLQVDDSR